jgi:DNA ligase 1
VTRTLSEIEKISGRLKILELMANMLRGILKFSPSDLIPTLYLCTNKVYPAHTGIELGLGDSLLMRAISESTGRSVEKLKTGA